MRYFSDIQETLDDLKVYVKNLEEDCTRLQNELYTHELRDHLNNLDVKPFMHPDGKITTIKMVRILDNSSFLDAKNKVDGWVRDGLVEHRVYDAAPFVGSTSYKKGDRVILQGVLVEAKRDVPAYECNGGPDNFFDNDRVCIFDHWKRVV